MSRHFFYNVNYLMYNKKKKIVTTRCHRIPALTMNIAKFSYRRCNGRLSGETLILQSTFILANIQFELLSIFISIIFPKYQLTIYIYIVL